MTTFTTKNQSRKRYYRVLAAVIIILILVTLIIWTRRERYKESNKSSSAASANDNRFKNGAAGHHHNGRQPFYNDELIEYEPVVLVQGMKIKGQVRTVVNGGTVASYLGIPYAEPPIDDRRFLPPVSKRPVDEVDPDSDQKQPETMDAFYQPYKCYQSSFVVSITEIKNLGDESREDCLYLNIWTPFQEDDGGGGCDDCNDDNKTTSKDHTHTTTTTNKPVMIFIHSGLFQYGGIGSPDLDPSLLVAEKQIVAITIQYRLGVFGFGSSDQQSSDDGFQSLGLQDQAKALEWVRENIEKFGGDPNRITLAGHGAGAMSIGFHLMHPRTKQMFQRAILQGVQNIWHIGIYGMNAKSVRYLMEDSNCDDESVRERDLIGCLRKQRIKPIILLEGQQYLADRFPIPFVPEFNPWTKRLEQNLTSIPANTKFNDSMDFLKLFKDWNIFSAQHHIMIGLNSDDDYIFQKYNKISTKVRFGDDQSDEEDLEEEVDYEEDADADEDSDTDDNVETAESKEKVETEIENDDETGDKSSENEDSNDDDDGENVNISDEIEVRDTSAEENKKMEMKMMMETTTMKMETATDDDDDQQGDVLKQHRRRRRRRRRRQANNNNKNSTLYKLDLDEKIKLCRLVKMYEVFKANGHQVSREVLFYRIDPKVLVDVLEEVSFAFGAKSNWLKGLDRHTMNVWGSFVNNGILGIVNSDERLLKYDPKVGFTSVNIINIGQTTEEDNHSQPSIIKFDGTMECPSDS